MATDTFRTTNHVKRDYRKIYWGIALIIIIAFIFLYSNSAISNKNAPLTTTDPANVENRNPQSLTSPIDQTNRSMSTYPNNMNSTTGTTVAPTPNTNIINNNPGTLNEDGTMNRGLNNSHPADLNHIRPGYPPSMDPDTTRSQNPNQFPNSNTNQNQPIRN